MDVKKDFVTFRVRTCSDAHLLLSRAIGETGENSAYEVVFGASSNTALYVRRGSLTYPKAGLAIPGLVSELKSGSTV